MGDDPHARAGGMFLFIARGAHLGLFAAIHDGDVFRAQKLGLHGGIHSRHPAANHDHIAANGQL